jgi:hypothetical protein
MKIAASARLPSPDFAALHLVLQAVPSPDLLHPTTKNLYHPSARNSFSSSIVTTEIVRMRSCAAFHENPAVTISRRSQPLRF